MHSFFFFFFNDTATTEIYTLSLHDALPIFPLDRLLPGFRPRDLAPVHEQVKDHVIIAGYGLNGRNLAAALDRKSTRLNSSHLVISYAVFCLKKKTHSKRDIPHSVSATQ